MGFSSGLGGSVVRLTRAAPHGGPLPQLPRTRDNLVWSEVMRLDGHGWVWLLLWCVVLLPVVVVALVALVVPLVRCLVGCV